jgi:hypothetical protein
MVPKKQLFVERQIRCRKLRRINARLPRKKRGFLKALVRVVRRADTTP